MAKSTFNSTFRKIDVDQFNDDYYKDEENNEAQSPPTGPDEQEINNLLNQGKNIEALKSLLKNAPIGSKNQIMKDSAFNLVQKILFTIKASEIEKVVTSMDRDLLDVLMKYIYRGFENPSEGSSGHLLAWHEKVYATGGVGSIVRVLTDRKRV
ncbi:actin-related protein 2/3 complex subunit 5-B [Centruroides vittatus]|uniref:actin-related protein 2/3 complex subunit 5-like n=1 Tax=Centruroides sculpturatus TaxID=218467 RepID=UPI000C6E23A7|nr:actin-related protein 2/3 complex subunit 5-like [Centruroides sculpturatus]